MHAMLSTAPGGPETLTLTELDDPSPRKGEVVIAIKAAGVNFPDTLIIRDLYQFKPARPFAPGNEVAGVIHAVGEGVEEFAPGDRVAATLGASGAYATMGTTPATAVHKIGNVPFDIAASMIMTYGTSLHALKDRAHLAKDETLLVLGASGGVGSAAIELGKAMGARVIGAVSSEEKAAFCRDLGADDTIVYPREMDRDGQKAFGQAIKDAVGGNGVDVCYDAVGGAYAEPAIRSMAWRGRFLVVGFPAGIPSIPLNLALLKGCDIQGVFWGAATQREPKAHQENMTQLWQMVEDGTIRPRVTATFPLAKAADALRLLEARKATGKLVITMD